MFKDYYAILNISQLATLAEIKSAYRTQAMKWHPDKNHGVDTTDKMKEMNEAKLILTDEEARIRYDTEYLKFKSFQKEEKSKWQKQYERKAEDNKANEDKSYQKKAEKPKEEYSTYTFDDEILKKWVGNARKQAIRNVNEMVKEFRDSSIAGLNAFFKTALIAIAVGVIFFIIVQILKSI